MADRMDAARRLHDVLLDLAGPAAGDAPRVVVRLELTAGQIARLACETARTNWPQFAHSLLDGTFEGPWESEDSAFRGWFGGTP